MSIRRTRRSSTPPASPDSNSLDERLPEHVKISLYEAIRDSYGLNPKKAKLKKICDSNPKVFGSPAGKRRRALQKYFDYIKSRRGKEHFREQCLRYDILDHPSRLFASATDESLSAEDSSTHSNDTDSASSPPPARSPPIARPPTVRRSSTFADPSRSNMNDRCECLDIDCALVKCALSTSHTVSCLDNSAPIIIRVDTSKPFDFLPIGKGMNSAHYVQGVKERVGDMVYLRNAVIVRVIVHRKDIAAGYVKLSIANNQELILQCPGVMEPFRAVEFYEAEEASHLAEAENKEEKDAIRRITQVVVSDMIETVEKKSVCRDYVLRFEHIFDLKVNNVGDMLDARLFFFGELVCVQWRIVTAEQERQLTSSPQPKKKYSVQEKYHQKLHGRDREGDANMGPDHIGS